MKHVEFVASAVPVQFAVQLANELRKAGFRVRAHAAQVYSYQGGDHRADAKSWDMDRPKDWENEGISFAPEGTEYHAHPGDVLILCGVEDRYGYSQERNLEVVRLCDGDENPKPGQATEDLMDWIDSQKEESS